MLNRHGLNSRTWAQSRDRRGDAVAGLQDDEVQAAGGEVGGGGHADRPGADHRDGNVRGALIVSAPSDGCLEDSRITV